MSSHLSLRPLLPQHFSLLISYPLTCSDVSLSSSSPPPPFPPPPHTLPLSPPPPPPPPPLPTPQPAHVFDNTTTWGGSPPLDKSFIGGNSSQLSFSRVITECERNSSVVEVLHLNERLNISGSIMVSSEMTVSSFSPPPPPPPPGP